MIIPVPSRTRARSVAMLFLLLADCVVLAASPPESRRQSNSRIVIQCLYVNERAGVRILDVTVEAEGRHGTRPREHGEYMCKVVDDDGSVMFSTAVHIPNRLYY